MPIGGGTAYLRLSNSIGAALRALYFFPLDDWPTFVMPIAAPKLT